MQGTGKWLPEKRIIAEKKNKKIRHHDFS